MSSKVGNLILESCSLPGASAVITLNGPPTGRAPFSSRFQAGGQAYYFLHDGDRWETALGTFGGGTPSTLTRPTTVIANSLGTTARVNFPGMTNVICEAPAEQWVLLDDFENVVVPNVGGYMRFPRGIIIQWGFAVTNAGGGVDVTFPIVFPTLRGPVLTQTAGATQIATVGTVIGGTFPNTVRIFAFNTVNGAPLASGVYWFALGY